MKARLTILLAAILGLWASAASAQLAGCGGTYTVVQGDTLSKISTKLYGTAQNYQLVYSANSSVIGPNPGVIEIGAVLEVPCLEGEIRTAAASAAVIRPEATTERLAAPRPGGIRFLTATDWAPFTDQEQEQGGMLTEVVNVAMARVKGEDEYRIDFVNDWAAHLQPLLSDNAYDIGFPWFRPNCDVIDKLGPESQFRCNNLNWSEPLFEMAMGFFTRADFPTALSFSDLNGTTICRPKGNAIFMLEERDLVEPNVTMLWEKGPAECIEAVLDGRADAAHLANEVAGHAIMQLDAGGRIVAQDRLQVVSTLHAVTSKNNPDGEAYLEIFNKGLNQIKDDGEWFAIVRRQMAEHRAM